jgi:hypothetical protein
MQINLKRLSLLSSFLLSIAFSINFLSYAIQPYVPPSIIEHSASYSIQNCPSHSIQNHLSHVIHHISKSEKNEGTEKQCFCFNRRGIQGSSFITFKPSIKALVGQYSVYLFPLGENTYGKEFYSILSGRSPPILS